MSKFDMELNIFSIGMEHYVIVPLNNCYSKDLFTQFLLDVATLILILIHDLVLSM